MNRLSILTDLKLSPELILAVIILVGAIALKALGKIDDTLLYSLIMLAIGLIGGGYARQNYLKSQGLLK